jgi:HEAT repeat protein
MKRRSLSLVAALLVLILSTPVQAHPYVTMTDSQKIELAKQIGTQADESNYPLLIVMLDDPSWAVRQEAAEWIARANNPLFYPAILREYLTLAGKEGVPLSYTSAISRAMSGMGVAAVPHIAKWVDDPGVTAGQRAYLAWQLGHLATKSGLVAESQDPVLVATLRKLLKDSDWSVKLRAAGSLGRAGLNDGYDIAVEGLSLPPGFSRMVAAWALAFIPKDGTALALPVALDGLETSPDRASLQEAIHALSNLAPRVTKEQRNQIADKMVPFTKHEEAGIRSVAVRAIGLTFDHSKADVVADAMLHDADNETRFMGAQAFWQWGRYHPALLEAVSDPYFPVRNWSLRALYKVPLTSEIRTVLLERQRAEPDKGLRDLIKVMLAR